MSEQLKVIILTTKLPEDIWLINKVADICQVAGIVFPKGIRYREYGLTYVLKKSIRRSGLIKLADQALLVLYRLIFESKRDKLAEKKLFGSKPDDYLAKKEIDTLEVDDINSDRVRDFILTKAPHLVIVSGAPLLKKRILQTARGKFINLHPGFAPQYRGRYGSFWPIYNKEPEFVGTTVHIVDEGVDTGPILLQQLVDFNPDDTLRTITYQQHKLGGELLVKVLLDFESYAAKAFHKTGSKDKNYLAPGLSHYIKGRWWLRKNRGVLATFEMKKSEIVSEIGE